MVPISTTSQGGEAPAAKGSARPLGRDPWIAVVLPLPRSTIVKRTAGLKPKFDAEMLSAYAVLQKWPVSGLPAAAPHPPRTGEPGEYFSWPAGRRGGPGVSIRPGALRLGDGRTTKGLPRRGARRSLAA